MDKRQIGEQIASLRKQRGMKQKDLAEKLKVATSTLCKWENGQNCPDINMVKEIATVLNVSYAELLDGTSIENVSEKEREASLSKKNFFIEFIQNKKYWFIFFLCLIGVILIGVLSYHYGRYQNHTLIFQVVSERYTEDTLYGKIYEWAVIVPEGLESVDLEEYLEEVQERWQLDSYGDKDTKVLKISYYTNKSDAKNWVKTEACSFVFKVPELEELK